MLDFQTTKYSFEVKTNRNKQTHTRTHNKVWCLPATHRNVGGARGHTRCPVTTLISSLFSHDLSWPKQVTDHPPPPPSLSGTRAHRKCCVDVCSCSDATWEAWSYCACVSTGSHDSFSYFVWPHKCNSGERFFYRSVSDSANIEQKSICNKRLSAFGVGRILLASFHLRQGKARFPFIYYLEEIFFLTFLTKLRFSEPLWTRATKSPGAD